MENNSFLFQAMVYLAAAVIMVPLAKRLGLGSVLGYLLAGILIGPTVLQFIGTEGQDLMHSAEFGVVMMLFLIGLELEPVDGSCKTPLSSWESGVVIYCSSGSSQLTTENEPSASFCIVHVWQYLSPRVWPGTFSLQQQVIEVSPPEQFLLSHHPRDGGTAQASGIEET